MEDKSKVIIDEDWKFCALISIHFDETYQSDLIRFEDSVIRIFRPTDINIGDSFVAEVFTKRDKYSDIETALYGCEEILERFLQRITLITFRPSYILNNLGVSQYRTDANKKFKMLIPNAVEAVYELYSGPKDIESLIKGNTLYQSPEVNEALRELKSGMQSHSIFLRFFHMYNVIERIANKRTSEFVERRCSECGHMENTPIKATSNEMKRMFKESDFSDKEYNLCRKIRGKLAHGAGSRDQKLIKDVHSSLGKVEKVAAKYLSEETEMKVLSGTTPRVRNSFMTIVGIKTKEKGGNAMAEYHIEEYSYSTSFSIGQVEDTMEKDNDFRPFHTPMPMDISPENFPIFPYLWPY